MSLTKQEMKFSVWLWAFCLLPAEGLTVLPPAANSSATEFVSDTDDITTTSSVAAGSLSRPSKIVSLAAAKRDPGSMEPKAPPKVAALLQSGSYTAGSIQDSNGNVISVVRPSLPNDPDSKRIQNASLAQSSILEDADRKRSETVTTSAIPTVSQSSQGFVEAKLRNLTAITSKLPHVTELTQFDEGKLPGTNIALSTAAPPFWDWLPFSRETTDEVPETPSRTKQEKKDEKDMNARTARVALRNKIEDDEQAAEVEEEAERAKHNAHRLKVVENRYGTNKDEEVVGMSSKQSGAMEAEAARKNAAADVLATAELSKDQTKTQQKIDATTKTTLEARTNDNTKGSKIGTVEPSLASSASSLATKTTFDMEGYGKEAYEAINKRRTQLAEYVKQKMQREANDKKRHRDSTEKAAIIAMEMRPMRIHEDMESRKEIAAALKCKKPI